MARPRSSERITLSIRLDRENEKWLRLYAVLNRKTLADVLNNVLNEKRKENPIQDLLNNPSGISTGRVA